MRAPNARQRLERILSERILIIDGAMGTMMQRAGLEEADYRGERFQDHDHDLKGDHDLLSLTRPEVVESMHRTYLEAGADIIETNTFTATRIAQADYGTEDAVYDMNRASAEIARRVAAEFSAKNPEKPRWVAGSLGPTNRTASLSPDVTDPGKRLVTFEP